MKLNLLLISLFLGSLGIQAQETASPEELIWHNGTYLKQDSTPFHGSLKESYANGNLKMAVNVTHGKANGTLKLFFPNRQSKMLVGYDNGQPLGGFSEYFFNGELKFQCTIKGPATGGGSQAELIRYAYYQDSLYVNKTKVFGRIHFFNNSKLTSLFNEQLAPHTIAGYIVTDRNGRSKGVFLEDSRKVNGPPNRTHWDGE